MFKKVNTILLAGVIVLIAAVAFLLVKYNKMQQQVEALQAANTAQVNIKPIGSDSTKQVNPAEVSPFDKPNNDPMAIDYPPNTGTPPPLTRVKFDKTLHDFGRIKEGEKVKTRFSFTNIGPNPLIITNAKPSCGCTVPSWPKKPIPPGESGEILVEFDSMHKSGEQSKTVTVMANMEPAQVQLTLKSIVIPIDR